MPISSKYLKLLKGMSSYYCTPKYGKDGIKDKSIQGVSTCKKSRGVFYAYTKKRGIDYTLSNIKEFEEFAELSEYQLTEDDLVIIATQMMIDSVSELTEPLKQKR